jgi:hypothetical protein
MPADAANGRHDLIPREMRRKRHEQRRIIGLFSVSALAYLTQVFDVSAGFYCERIEQLPAASDSRTAGLLEQYARELAGPKRFQIKQLTSRFFLVMPDDENCRVVPCYYRLLDVKDGEVKERFSFHGTGAIWYFSSPAEVRIEDFQDYFSSYGLETSAKTHIRVLLPRTAQAVVVEAVPPDELLPNSCRTESR